jgi:hypothetical protein
LLVDLEIWSILSSLIEAEDSISILNNENQTPVKFCSGSLRDFVLETQCLDASMLCGRLYALLSMYGEEPIKIPEDGV